MTLEFSAALDARGFDVDLTVDEGETVAVLGPNGAGKSTLLDLVAGLLRPDRGAARLNGRVLFEVAAGGRGHRLAPHERGVSLLAQDPLLFPHLSVLDNVTLASRAVLGVDRAAAEERGLALLDRVGLGGHARSFPDRLSGGQQQRAAIARAIATTPELLLLDEVTSALDPELVGEVLELVRELSADGVTIVMATHEMAFARDVADRVVFLEKGRILEQGPPAQLFGDPAQERTREFLARFRGGL
jgi:polar amino acid transport system ATP-binding protein